MKTSTFLLLLICFSLITYLSLSFLDCNKSEQTTKFIRGKSDTVYVKGDTVIKFDTIYYHQQEKILQPAGNDVSFNFIDSNYSLTIDLKTYPKADSIDLNYFLDIKTKTLEIIDTLFVTRVDTMRLTKVVEESRAFLDSFVVGFSAATLIILIISLIFK